MSLVKRRISDKWIIRMIKGWLNQAIFKQDETALANIRYSSRFSHKPLLANIYLHSLDKYWQMRHNEWDTQMVRYYDDLVILIRNKNPKTYMESLKRMLSKLKLELSEEKTPVVFA